MYNLKKDVVLFTPYYTAKTIERQKELDECVIKNVECKHIKKIILLIDDSSVSPIDHKKIEVIYINSKPTYKQWFELSSKYKNTITVLANSDIYFNDTLKEIHNAFTVSNTFMCLTRYEREKGVITQYPTPKWSQDVWAYSTDTVINENTIKLVDIQLGTPRCDNKIAYIMAISGWKIINPINYIITTHIHETQQRSYNTYLNDDIIGGIAFIEPGSKIDSPVSIEISVWHKNNSSHIQAIQCLDILNKWKGQYQQLTLPCIKDISNNFLEEIKTIPSYVIIQQGHNIVNTKKQISLIDVQSVTKWYYSDVLPPEHITESERYTFNQLHTHIECLRDFLQSKDSYRMIFETNIECYLPSNLKNMFQSLTLDCFDVLYLGSTISKCAFLGQDLYIDQIRNTTPNECIYNVKTYDVFAYIVNRRFAYEVLNKFSQLEENKVISIAELYTSLNYKIKTCNLINKINVESVSVDKCGIFIRSGDVQPSL